MNIRPIGNKVIVKEVDPDEVSAGGIFIPQTAQKNGHAPSKAEVVAVGTGPLVDGVRQEIPLKKGDIVIIPAYQGEEIKIEGEALKVLNADTVLGVIEG